MVMPMGLMVIIIEAFGERLIFLSFGFSGLWLKCG